MSTSHECPFWIGRTSKERHAELYAEIEAKFPRTNAKGDKNAGFQKKTLGRKKVGFSNPDAEGFIQVGIAPGIARVDAAPSGTTAGIARIDAIPSQPPSPSPDSVKPAAGSIVGALADEALRPELRGNDDARKLMQETLLDEAAFAAADALEAADVGRDSAPVGSPPLSLSYA